MINSVRFLKFGFPCDKICELICRLRFHAVSGAVFSAHYRNLASDAPASVKLLVGMPENLQLLCAYCNKIKGNRGMEYLIAQLQL